MTPPRPRFSPWPLAALPAAGLLALMAAAAGFAEGPPMSPVVEAPPVVKGTAAQGEPRPVDDDRQISYEVRYVDGPAERWRELLLPRIKQLRQEAELSAWIIDDAALRDLLVSSQQDPHTNVLSAPKLTAFHKTKASVMNRTKHFYVAGVEEVAAPRAGFSPQVKHVEAGVSLEMTGSIVPRGTHLSVEIVDDSVLGFHVIQRRKRVGEVVVAATYQIPTTANHRWNLDCEIPRGTQLLISLGVHDAPGSLPDAANLANGVLERVGLPAYHATPVTLERLVIITPRPIVLESEERRGVPRAAITNATDGSR